MQLVAIRHHCLAVSPLAPTDLKAGGSLTWEYTETCENFQQNVGITAIVRHNLARTVTGLRVVKGSRITRVLLLRIKTDGRLRGQGRKKNGSLRKRLHRSSNCDVKLQLQSFERSLHLPFLFHRNAPHRATGPEKGETTHLGTTFLPPLLTRPRARHGGSNGK